MQRTEIICDICGARKGENNHWWLGGNTKAGFHLYPASYNIAESDYDLGNKQDYCSENCASRALSEFMSKIKSDADEQLKRIMSEELERDPTLRGNQ